MNEKYQLLHDRIYQKLEELSHIQPLDKDGNPKDPYKYRIWYENGKNYLGADLNVVFTGRNIADIILKASAYIREHSKYEDGRNVDLLQHHIEYLIDYCSRMTNIETQIKDVIRGLLTSSILRLQKVK